MISIGSDGLVIDTVVCVTLAKWETVSSQVPGAAQPKPNMRKNSGHYH